MIGRAQILDLIPHGARMCLVDRVLRWDRNEIVCATDGHRDVNHPLRRDNTLSAVHLVEYGAQAMAIHGGLLARNKGVVSRGMLVAVRNLRLELDRLDDLQGELCILARRQTADDRASIYQFDAYHADRLLAVGRISVMLRPDGFAAAVP